MHNLFLYFTRFNADEMSELEFLMYLSAILNPFRGKIYHLTSKKAEKIKDYDQSTIHAFFPLNLKREFFVVFSRTPIQMKKNTRERKSRELFEINFTVKILNFYFDCFDSFKTKNHHLEILIIN